MAKLGRDIFKETDGTFTVHTKDGEVIKEIPSYMKAVTTFGLVDSPRWKHGCMSDRSIRR